MNNIKVHTEIPDITKHTNRYFKAIIVTFMNSRYLEKSSIPEGKYFYFKYLIKVFRNTCHLCIRKNLFFIFHAKGNGRLNYVCMPQHQFVWEFFQ